MTLKEKLAQFKISDNKINALLKDIKEQLKQREIISLSNVGVKKGKSYIIIEMYGYDKKHAQVFITNGVKIKW